MLKVELIHLGYFGGNFSGMKAIIGKIKNGDEKAFRILYDKYKDKLYYFCLKYVKSEDVAGDILQEVFIKIWNFRDQLNEDQNFDAFIFKILKNNLINYLQKEEVRKAKNSEAVKENLQITNETEDGVIYNDYNRLINEAIEAMPPKRKEVFRLSRKLGFTHDEIARNLDISPNTVEVHIGKALNDIRSFMRKHAGDELLINFK